LSLQANLVATTPYISTGKDEESSPSRDGVAVCEADRIMDLAHFHSDAVGIQDAFSDGKNSVRVFGVPEGLGKLGAQHLVLATRRRST
jgi:hypothetical protein